MNVLGLSDVCKNGAFEFEDPNVIDPMTFMNREKSPLV